MQLEADWLATADARAEAAGLLRTWLPSFDPNLFAAALDGALRPASICGRVSLGRRVQAQLRPFARHGRVAASVAGATQVHRQSDPPPDGVAEETGACHRRSGRRVRRHRGDGEVDDARGHRSLARRALHGAARSHRQAAGDALDLPSQSAPAGAATGRPGQRSTVVAARETSEGGGDEPTSRSRCCSGSVRFSSPTTGERC